MPSSSLQSKRHKLSLQRIGQDCYYLWNGKHLESMGMLPMALSEVVAIMVTVQVNVWEGKGSNRKEKSEHDHVTIVSWFRAKAYQFMTQDGHNFFIHSLPHHTTPSHNTIPPTQTQAKSDTKEDVGPYLLQEGVEKDLEGKRNNPIRRMVTPRKIGRIGSPIRCLQCVCSWRIQRSRH